MTHVTGTARRLYKLKTMGKVVSVIQSARLWPVLLRRVISHERMAWLIFAFSPQRRRRTSTRHGQIFQARRPWDVRSCHHLLGPMVFMQRLCPHWDCYRFPAVSFRRAGRSGSTRAARRACAALFYLAPMAAKPGASATHALLLFCRVARRHGLHDRCSNSCYNLSSGVTSHQLFMSPCLASPRRRELPPLVKTIYMACC